MLLALLPSSFSFCLCPALISASLTSEILSLQFPLFPTIYVDPPNEGAEDILLVRL